MPATLVSLIANNHGLRVFCGSCSHVVDMDVPKLAERYGKAMPLPEIARRASCRACGGRGGSVQVVAVEW